MRWIDNLLGIAEGFTSVVFAVVVAGELLNLVLRYGFSSGIPEISEAAGIVVVVVGFLGMARGFAYDDHVRFEAIQKKLPGVWRPAAVGLAYVFTFLTLVIMAYTGFVGVRQFSNLYLQAISMPWLPFWAVLATIPIGAVLSIAGVLRALARNRDLQ